MFSKVSYCCSIVVHRFYCCSVVSVQHFNSVFELTLYCSSVRPAALRHSTSSFRALRVKEVCNSKRQHAALLLCTPLHSESLHWPAPAAAHADALSNLPLSTTIGHAGRCADARATRRSCARHGSGGEVAAAARRHSKATKKKERLGKHLPRQRVANSRDGKSPWTMLHCARTAGTCVERA